MSWELTVCNKWPAEGAKAFTHAVNDEALKLVVLNHSLYKELSRSTDIENKLRVTKGEKGRGIN